MIFARAGCATTAAPGTWFTFPRSSLENVKHPRHGHVAVVCPICHGTLTLSSAIHKVANDGTVSPSFVCTKVGCTFHTFIRLAGW